MRGRVVEINGDLQREFSLNQTLSLYLLDTLPGLDPQSPTYALDVLTLVESILEDPDAVLRKQLDREKGTRIAQMKADGMDYEQRMAELENIEWPKPCRDFIYETFNAFADKHPWVGSENIRPKSVAREMYETLATFSEYVRDLGLERSEGVLLRYLAEAYRTIEQTVPPAFRTPEVDDIASHLRALLRQTDSSLLEEWESLRDGGEAGPVHASALRRRAHAPPPAARGSAGPRRTGAPGAAPPGQDAGREALRRGGGGGSRRGRRLDRGALRRRAEALLGRARVVAGDARGAAPAPHGPAPRRRQRRVAHLAAAARSGGQ